MASPAEREESMPVRRLAGAVLALVLGCGAAAAEPVRIGIVAPFSGPFANFGEGWKHAIEAYQKVHGRKAGGQDVEIIFRDLPEPNPAAARALAQELAVKDKVQYIGGIVFTPNALAIAPVSDEAKIPTVIFNAATSAITKKSEYLIRTSYTLWQVTVPIAKYVLEQNVRKIVTIVSDYGPGLDAEAAFVKTFEAGGGTIVEKIRVPLRTTDFGPFVQRIKEIKPEALYAFFPGGPPAFGMIKAYKDNGLREAGIRFFGSSETDEKDLPNLGDAAIGLETGLFYSAAHPSTTNKAFIDALPPGAVANAIAVEGYDGLHAIYRMVEVTKGKRDPQAAMAAVKGYAWESPRGPVRIDPVSRHIIQNIYMRKVERDAGGKLVNREFRTFEAQPDYGFGPSDK
jgi:branched-chain amino acid transport system substrate-binding protein